MRGEELNALQWGDLEFDAGKLYVRRSLHWTRDHGQVGTVLPRVGPTKTNSGERPIPLPAELCAMLKVWRLAAPPSAN